MSCPEVSCRAQKATEATLGQVKTWILLGEEAFSLVQTYAAIAGLFCLVWVHNRNPGLRVPDSLLTVQGAEIWEEMD